MIEHIDQLIVAPALAPHSEQVRTTAGVDDIVAHLRSRHLRQKAAKAASGMAALPSFGQDD